MSSKTRPAKTRPRNAESKPTAATPSNPPDPAPPKAKPPPLKTPSPTDSPLTPSPKAASSTPKKNRNSASYSANILAPTSPNTATNTTYSLKPSTPNGASNACGSPRPRNSRAPLRETNFPFKENDDRQAERLPDPDQPNEPIVQTNPAREQGDSPTARLAYMKAEIKRFEDYQARVIAQMNNQTKPTES
jgi:hypothetical protein